MSEDHPNRKVAFGMRSLLVVVAVVSFVTYLFTAAPGAVSTIGLFLIAAGLPAVLAVGALYDRESRRAFYIGAMLPSAGYFLGTMSYCVQFVEFLPYRSDVFADFLNRMAGQLQAWSAVVWIVSAVVGLMAEGARRCFQANQNISDG